MSSLRLSETISMTCWQGCSVHWGPNDFRGRRDGRGVKYGSYVSCSRPRRAYRVSRSRPDCNRCCVGLHINPSARASNV
jgi:hypothetical protein